MSLLKIIVIKSVTFLLLTTPFFSCGQKGTNKKQPATTLAKNNKDIVPGNYPDVCRYSCYRLGVMSNEIADDVTILSPDTYEVLNTKGKYKYDPSTEIITWLSGPLFQPKENWVGIFSPKGTPTPAGGKTVSAIIEIRRMSDVKEGNLRVIQNCSCAQ